jgi:hypothetical protein
MTNDGTQDPGPPPVVADPLSGLVTGSRYEAEPVTVRVVEPVMPDITAVREAVAGMLDEDSELDLELVDRVAGRAGPEIPTQAGPVEPPAPPAAPAAPADPPPAEAAEPAPAAPPADPTPTPPFGVPAQRRAPVAPPAPVEAVRRLPLGWPRLRRRGSVPRPASAIGRKSSAPSVTAIILLLVVMGVIAIVLLASLIDTLASIFS